MKNKNYRSKNQSGFFSGKAALAVGAALAVTLSGVTAYANSVAPTSMNTSGVENICVTASWADDMRFSAQRGNCDPRDVNVPGDESDTDTSAVLNTYTCGSETLNITQAMQEHSEQNQALKGDGRTTEMIPYPEGGWKIIVLGSTVHPSIDGVYLTKSGIAMNSDATNTSGPAVVVSMGDNCEMHKIVDGKIHSDNGPAQIKVYEDGASTNMWALNNLMHREGLPAYITYDKDGDVESERYAISNESHRTDGPAIISYSKGKITGESWYINGKLHKTDGPAFVNYDENGDITDKQFSISGIEYKLFDSWVAAGGEPSAWF